MNRRRWLLGLGVLMGLPLGYAGRSLAESAWEQRERQRASQALTGYLKSSARSLAALDAALRSTREALARGVFPTRAATDLGHVDLTLDATSMSLLHVSVLGSKTASLFFEFTRLAALASAGTERLATLLTGETAQDLRRLLLEGNRPHVVWAAELVQTEQGTWGRVRPLDRPFSVDEAWPSRLALIGERYQDRFESRRPNELGLLPIDPSTLDRPHARRLLNNVLLEIERLGLLLHGGPSGQPGLGSIARVLLERVGHAKLGQAGSG